MLGRFPLQVHVWQQILRCHHSTIALDNIDVCLTKLGTVDGFALDQRAVLDSWQHFLGGLLHGQQQLFHTHCICRRKRAKHQHIFENFAYDQHSSLMLYRTMQAENKPAEYLSVVKCASNKRLISSCRTGCHGLWVDTGWADGIHLDRTHWLCQMCKSLYCVEHEQH